MEPPKAAAHASSWTGRSSHRLGMESRVWGLEILGRFGGAWIDFGGIRRNDLARERSISGAGGTIWREGRVDLAREGAGKRGGARDRRRRLLRLRRAGSGRFVLGSDNSAERVVERPLRSLPSFLFLSMRTFLTCTCIPPAYVAP
ncbi:hypothetical protein PVAP13_4KG174833 [Panicum virgatum]|uniref:Uncharacterized protein n=1 Tax=Panicum virgatum TaxID=38727 RepID=A0A8T0TKI8_PANVG|nr:hypothetical protein PVAP13_4KG174833 [Panicum virgatum]